MTNVEVTYRISARMPVRTARIKKTTDIPSVENNTTSEVTPAVKTTAKTDPFNTLLKVISELQSDFEKLQKEIAQSKESWTAEQKAHQKQLADGNIQEELERKRNKETYEYETARKQKQAEDEFADKKASWEKSLKDQQEILTKEKTELAELRKLAAGFEGEKEKIIAQAQEILRKELTGQFETERKLTEQEQKAEKDILNLKITNFTAENNRLNTEIISLKKALEEATRQVKEIAVKVIESGTKSQSPESLPKFDK